eukprot:6370038-Pyramimonas_sp.AAC.1
MMLSFDTTRNLSVFAVRASPPAAGPPSMRMGSVRVASVRLGAALAHLGASCGGGQESSAHTETMALS